MQKQLEALSFLDKRKATKQKLVTDQVTSVSGAPPVSDQVIVPAQQQTSGYMASSPNAQLQFRKEPKTLSANRVCIPAVASPSKVPPAKAVKRVAPVSRRLYSTLETLLVLLCEW
jgi:hypothetical protein